MSLRYRLRMERQATKAEKVAAAVAAHPNVDRVFFPGHYASETNNADRCQKMQVYDKQCTGSGSMISFIVRPNTREAAYKVLDRVEIAHLAVSLGSTETLMEHPRSMTHSDMTVEDLDGCGIVEGMLRLSVGLESSKDLIKDLLSALDSIDEIKSAAAQRLDAVTEEGYPVEDKS
jgi:methionine-gamma-lyase